MASVIGNVVTTQLVDETDLAAGTYYYPSEDDGMKVGRQTDLSLAFVLSGGVTLTLEAKTEEDDAVSSTWQDITKAGFNITNNSTGFASFVDISGIVDWDNLNVTAWRAKIVTSDSTNTVKVVSRQKAVS